MEGGARFGNYHLLDRGAALLEHQNGPLSLAYHTPGYRGTTA